MILRYINGYTTFIEGFGYGFLLWTIVNIYDAIVIDIIWFCHNPDFVFKGTEDMVDEYHNYWFHIKESLIGEVLALVICTIVGLRLYPVEIQEMIKANEKYKNKVKPQNLIKIFITNLIMFVVILFIFGIFIKSNDFKTNFINILVLGEVLNLFDLIVIDLLWWRNTKRIRFKDIPEKKEYQNPKQHIDSFLRGIIMYLLVAIIDGIILTVI